ncbi:UDP-N-acetylmuramate dehydrogenase [Rhodobium orientis]|uniref:UDP-N-acetylenolpyruvoylglucosamine reductase n=1 Tax=Rhodobium orientis TaxID=34017 RepID=A0A327JFV9_9HYPH|nr:UDP-N-acetylmuramate dehydrogenase [Rhodobium orientis]MBB4305459.1 UDP-N-acetylmuramate dehydrogenase [Rhodobium orientis]MBK5948655.1 UDP-N-acetylenolpyruvoylglucosamine reductase [Rhodobium orientis]RAI25277.1 UDP-N-acetylenolpyruvoylglucosamine reductase [Rhodobium orientis]
MSGADLIDRLGDRLEGVRGRITADAPLSDITWFRVGGPADILFQPADADDLSLFLKRLPEDVPVLVIGLGSNLLVRDGGIPGVVIRLSVRGFGSVTFEEGNKARVGAAMPDQRFAKAAADAGVGGFSFYRGIPGAIGGALRMNAGAHGSETRERMVELTAVDRKGDVHRLTNADMGYAYRHSEAPSDLIFIEAVYQGETADPEVLKAEMDEVERYREERQPTRDKTGGSTFKNPPGNSSWKLIDAAGCRGLKVGGAQVSEKHCNFLINTGTATAADLELLGETVRARVLETSGIRLDWEIKRLGNLPEGVTIEPFLGR